MNPQSRVDAFVEKTCLEIYGDESDLVSDGLRRAVLLGLELGREAAKDGIVECSRECERSGDICSNGTSENIESAITDLIAASRGTGGE